MLVKTVKVGEVVQLGDVGAIKVKEKSGNAVKLGFAMPDIYPITVIASGIIPRRFIHGISGKPQLVPVAAAG